MESYRESTDGSYVEVKESAVVRPRPPLGGPASTPARKCSRQCSFPPPLSRPLSLPFPLSSPATSLLCVACLLRSGFLTPLFTFAGLALQQCRSRFRPLAGVTNAVPSLCDDIPQATGIGGSLCPEGDAASTSWGRFVGMSSYQAVDGSQPVGVGGRRRCPFEMGDRSRGRVEDYGGQPCEEGADANLQPRLSEGTPFRV